MVKVTIFRFRCLLGTLAHVLLDPWLFRHFFKIEESLNIILVNSFSG